MRDATHRTHHKSITIRFLEMSAHVHTLHSLRVQQNIYFVAHSKWQIAFHWDPTSSIHCISTLFGGEERMFEVFDKIGASMKLVLGRCTGDGMR